MSMIHLYKVPLLLNDNSKNCQKVLDHQTTIPNSLVKLEQY